MPELDETFLGLPLHALADAALSHASALGATHADVRIVRVRTGVRGFRNARVETAVDDEDLGLSVRVVHSGAWGFAAGVTLTPSAAAELAEQAVAVAKVSAALTARPVQLASEPASPRARWVSAYEVDPTEVPEPERQARFIELSERLMASDGVDHVQAHVQWAKENTFYADLAGSDIVQQRVRISPQLEVTRVSEQGFSTMRTLKLPTGKGWEYALEPDLDAEVAELPELLAEHVKAPSVTAGPHDLVIDPTNLFLTIHESIGHATELDRALGYEAAYAGTSFATFDQLGTLHYGSEVMHVTGDRVVEHGLSTVGWDDEGVRAQSFDLIKNGTLVGYQLNRQMAAEQGLGRSNGCAYADSAGHIPLQRMPNVSLQPAATIAGKPGPSTEELIAGVDDGIYIVGDKSWSIDMQRYNFQFTGQRFFKITNGRLAGQLRDVAYQATTTDFWASMEAVGGEQTYLLGGAFNCGKGQPGQAAPVSHGCPSALFRQVNVLNTLAEGGN